MKTKHIIFSAAILLLAVVVISISISAFSTGPNQSPEQRRSALLSELYSSIDAAALQGKYKCCIDPPCTMCYMGDWIWDDGSCHCDDMMMQGDFDKVCPQCMKGLEEGRCKSATGTSCEGPAG